MVPSALVVLDRLPLTPNGKLDRRALPAPELAPARCAACAAHAAGGVAVRLFAEVLGLARVGIDDNFFELGGDSIVSIQLVSRARRAGLSITPRVVFQHQTVAALAAVAGAAVEPGSALADADLARLAIGGLPATPIMRWLRSAADRSAGSARRCCCGCRRGCRKRICGRRLARCSIITMRCGCGSMGRRRTGTGGWRLRRRMRLRPGPGAAGGGRRSRRGGVARADRGGGGGGGGRLDPAAGVMVQAVWFDAGRRVPDTC